MCCSVAIYIYVDPLNEVIFIAIYSCVFFDLSDIHYKYQFDLQNNWYFITESELGPEPICATFH